MLLGGAPGGLKFTAPADVETDAGLQSSAHSANA
jgi:hypothetical protein